MTEAAAAPAPTKAAPAKTAAGPANMSFTYFKRTGQMKLPTRPQKKNDILQDDSGNVVHRLAVSVDSPDFMKSSQQGHEISSATTPHAKTGAQSAGFKKATVKNRSQRTQIACGDTGRLANQTIVSAGSPGWMKGPFENNRSYFEEVGVAEARTQEHKHHNEALFPAAKQESGAYTRNVWTKNQEADYGKRKAAAGEGRIVQGAVSQQCPEWMQCPANSNLEFFEVCGNAKSMMDARMADAAGQGATAGKGTKLGTKQETDAMLYHPKARTAASTGAVAFVSHQAPEWMQSHDSKGFAQKRDKEINELHESGSAPAGIGKSPMQDKIGQGRLANPQGQPTPRKKRNFVNDKTGEVFNNTIVSHTAPNFMKSAFESNRDYFEKEGIVQKLDRNAATSKMLSIERQQLGMGGGKKMVSSGAQRRQRKINHGQAQAAGKLEFTPSSRSTTETNDSSSSKGNLRAPWDRHDPRQTGIH